MSSHPSDVLIFGAGMVSPSPTWSNRIKVVERLQSELQLRGVRFVQSQPGWSAKPQQQKQILSDGSSLS